MDNVVSIYTRKTPCDNLHLNEDVFMSLGDDNSFYYHVDNCTDCSRRFLMLMSHSIANEILENPGILFNGED